MTARLPGPSAAAVAQIPTPPRLPDCPLRLCQEKSMADEIREEELLRSIDEVDAKIQDFRNRVRALLDDIETHRSQPGDAGARAEAA